MFPASLRPSSGVLKTVIAASGICHNLGAAASFHRGLIRTVASSWIFLLILNHDARNHESKKKVDALLGSFLFFIKCLTNAE
jgi:hypothetical protein